MSKLLKQLKTGAKIVGNAMIIANKYTTHPDPSNPLSLTSSSPGLIPLDQDDYEVLAEGFEAAGKAMKKLKGPSAEEQVELDILRHKGITEADTEKSIRIDDAKTDNEIRVLEAKERIRQEGASFDWELDKEKKEYARSHPSPNTNLEHQQQDDSSGFETTNTEIPDVRDISFTETRGLPIVPGLIWENDFVCIYGAQKTGKSFLGIQISIDAARGGTSSLFPKVDCSIPKCNVYFYASEGLRDAIKNRFPSGFFEECPNHHLMIADRYNCEAVINHFGRISATLTPGSHNLVIIDNLSNLANNKVRSSGVDSFIDRLDDYINTAKEIGAYLTVVLFAHSNSKGDEPFASSYIKKRAKTIIRFSGKKREMRSLLITDTGAFVSKDRFTLKPVGVEGDVDKLSFINVDGKDEACLDVETEKAFCHSIKRTDPRRKITDDEIADIVRKRERKESVDLNAIAKEKDVSLKTLYKWINKYKEEHQKS